ncbi:hypothetical protein SAICODRAFT_30654 [Saitoella complicata NRRL Y-17804]|uniref:uncharacterized protein n=1 Tax=Saitoella complicata (strain BCRC 22490 / CBS 7301 / JCM 7358 / NBRC 10748 / NRRL Y-17804) TaxID=698492 RepID=UPI0008674625|nr:uncharacterized protein SAICODRAFT_30654 [Saitoella complicata NRRL Y-17804]ODQ52513.1 hypothetical protein SAICODRAFT_30654 [Saitoella complicata NRRL Y-17804]
MASHILTFDICFNVITGHATCTIVWGIVGMVISIVFTLPRTLKALSFLAILSFLSILSAVLLTIIGVAVESYPAGYNGTAVAWMVGAENVEFYRAFAAVTNIVFAYAGHLAFFSFIRWRTHKTTPKLFACCSSPLRHSTPLPGP